MKAGVTRYITLNRGQVKMITFRLFEVNVKYKFCLLN